MIHSTTIKMTSYTPEVIQLLLDVKTSAYTSRHIVTTKRRISGQLEIDVWHAIDATSTTVERRAEEAVRNAYRLMFMRGMGDQ